MWLSRLSGLIIAAAGGSVVGFLWSQVLDRSGDGLFVQRLGIPGVLLLSAAGIIAFVFGSHLLVAPKSAVRRWTGRSARRA